MKGPKFHGVLWLEFISPPQNIHIHRTYGGEWAPFEPFKTVILGGTHQLGGVKGGLIVRGLGEDGMEQDDPGEEGDSFTSSSRFF